jgi:predicted nucleic acid-binding protein
VARPVNFTTIYLDSSALLKAIKNEDGHEHVAAVLRLVDLKQITVFGSPVTMVEVRGQPRGQHSAEIDRRVLADLDSARLNLVEFSRRVALRARDYVGRHGLKPLDAIHLASAVEAGAEVLWSCDGDFRKLWRSRVDGVWVDEPYEFGDQPLPGL